MADAREDVNVKVERSEAGPGERKGVRPQKCEAPFGPFRFLGSDPFSRRRRGGDIDMTPMVDVTFLLLIFFMVTAAFNLQKSIAVPPQHSDSAGRPMEDPQPMTITVQVDQRGSFFVMTPDWESEAIGKQKLIATLKRAVTESSQGPRVHVQVHELAELEALVMVLDAAATVGVADVKVTQVDSSSLSS